MINDKNWSHCHFKSEHSLAFLSIGGDTTANIELEAKILYFLTVTDHEYIEIFQESYEDVQLALNELNKRYGHWDMIDGESTSDDSCSSCAAH